MNLFILENTFYGQDFYPSRATVFLAIARAIALAFGELSRLYCVQMGILQMDNSAMGFTQVAGKTLSGQARPKRERRNMAEALAYFRLIAT